MGGGCWAWQLEVFRGILFALKCLMFRGRHVLHECRENMSAHQIQAMCSAKKSLHRISACIPAACSSHLSLIMAVWHSMVPCPSWSLEMLSWGDRE